MAYCLLLILEIGMPNLFKKHTTKIEFSDEYYK